MLRAMQASERAGVPAVGLFGAGFHPMALQLASQTGIPRQRLCVVPGVIATETDDRLAEVARTLLAPEVLRGLTHSGDAGAAPNDPPRAAAPRRQPVVLRGSLDQVQEYFDARGWSDGLPVIPPTPDRVEAFLRRTPRPPEDVLGVLAPDCREATVLSIAAHGVMAGCRPDYMPVLVAIVECLADPVFRIEDAGSTPGWEPLVVVSGPAARELDFNAGTGAMRVGRRANSSVGRFTRLYLRNVAGLRIPPGVTDQAGLGYTFNVAMAEDDEVVSRLGWPPFRVDRGHGRHESAVSVQSVVNIGAPAYSHGDDPFEHLNVIGHYLGRAIAPNVAVPSLKRGQGHHLLAISPAIAELFARHGIGKDEIRRHLYKHTTTAAGFLEYVGRQATPFDLHELARAGRLPVDYARTRDPERRVRVLLSPDSLGIVVTGNPARNQSRAYIGNHAQGVPVSRAIRDAT